MFARAPIEPCCRGWSFGTLPASSATRLAASFARSSPMKFGGSAGSTASVRVRLITLSAIRQSPSPSSRWRAISRARRQLCPSRVIVGPPADFAFVEFVRFSS